MAGWLTSSGDHRSGRAGSRSPQRSRRAAWALSAAAMLVAIALSTPAHAQATAPDEAEDPLADLATTAPAEVTGVDYVLDVVAVKPTADIRRAEDALDEASAAQSTASLRLIVAEQERAKRAAVLDDAGKAVADAERHDRDARAALVEAKAELARRQREEKRRRAALQVEQDRLRAMAAQLLTAVPDDRYLVFSDLDDITEATRRADARDRGVQLQSEAVEAAKRPWLVARARRRAQQHRTTRAQATATKAATDLVTARDDRDHATARLAEAATLADQRRATLDGATGRSAAALAKRRLARLDSQATDVPMRLVALHAYWRAAQLAPCAVPWWLIAGVGRIETGHGTAHGSQLTPEGDTTVHIVGIALDGRPGTVAIGDTDGGALDGDPVWDHAVGPMQFIPSTWGVLGRDGDGDGTKDPHNIYDAATAAAGLLCLGGDLTTEGGQRAGLLRYNASIPYGNLVLAEGHRYRDALDLPDIPPRPGDPHP